MKVRARKRVPKLKCDSAAEAFLARDLSQLDYSQFKSARFESERKERADRHTRAPAFAGAPEGAGESASQNAPLRSHQGRRSARCQIRKL